MKKRHQHTEAAVRGADWRKAQGDTGLMAAVGAPDERAPAALAESAGPT